MKILIFLICCNLGDADQTCSECIADISKRLSSLEDKVENMEIENVGLLEDVTNLNHENENLRNRIKNIETENEELINDVEDLEARVVKFIDAVF